MARNTQRIRNILDQMEDLFKGYPRTELHYETPLQLLIAVLLSAQTTDKQVNKATQWLFPHLTTPQDCLAMGREWVESKIATLWLYKTKAKNIIIMAQQLIDYAQQNEPNTKKNQWSNQWWEDTWRKEEWIHNDTVYSNEQQVYEDRWYYIPDKVEKLATLAGVWSKTAKVVAHILYGKRVVAVDTHVHRVMNRLGVVRTKYPEQTSIVLEKKIPDDYKDLAHRVIIYFWRYVCTAQRPQCLTCPLLSGCTWGKAYIPSTNSKAIKKTSRPF
jgi:endonuclease III